MSYRIQVISLFPDSENTTNLMKSIRQQGLEVEVFPAVDGRKNQPVLIDNERLDEGVARKKRLITLTNTEIGCYLSHYRAIKQAYQDGVDHLCLLEDDTMIENNFGAVINTLLNLELRFEFVRLMGLKQHRRKPIRILADNIWLTRPSKGLCGAQGYVINRIGMEKVIAKAAVIHEPIDKFYDHFWESGMLCFSVEPHVIWEIPSPSSVEKKSVKVPRGNVLQGLKKQINKMSRSIGREFYMLCRFNEFYPAGKPIKNPGRTARIH